MYGSSLMLVTRMLRDSRIAARDAAAIPLPREDTTPPVTKTYFAIYLACVGMRKSTGRSARRKISPARSGSVPDLFRRPVSLEDVSQSPIGLDALYERVQCRPFALQMRACA